MARANGINTDAMKIVGLSLSNGLVGLAGSLIAQYQGFADIGMGIGLIGAGLASVIIGTAILNSSLAVSYTHLGTSRPSRPCWPGRRGS